MSLVNAVHMLLEVAAGRLNLTPQAADELHAAIDAEQAPQAQDPDPVPDPTSVPSSGSSPGVNPEPESEPELVAVNTSPYSAEVNNPYPGGQPWQS